MTSLIADHSVPILANSINFSPLDPDSQGDLDALSLFGIIQRDHETVLVPPTTTRIPDRTNWAGTERTRFFTLLTTRPRTVTTDF